MPHCPAPAGPRAGQCTLVSRPRGRVGFLLLEVALEPGATWGSRPEPPLGRNKVERWGHS